MITLQQICSYLDEFLHCQNFTDYGPNGLQVEGGKDISKIAFAVTASLKVIEEAVKIGANCLIVHHGLFWKYDSFEVVGTKKKKLKLLLENDISLLGYHLPLDAHIEFGNNWVAARELGLVGLEEFGEVNGQCIGVKGEISPIKTDDFQKKLEEFYNHEAATALGGKEIIESAALISGGGYKYLTQAAKNGVDCFITGNFDEPAWHQAYEEGINFFALGHTATERIGPLALEKHLKKKFKVETIFIDSDNPF